MTAQHFFHKFFQTMSFKRHDRFDVAQACLFLAAKVEEAPASLRAVVATCYRVRRGGKAPLDEASPDFARRKQTVLRLERAVLYALGFDVSVSNPILPFSELLARLVACGSLPDARQRQFAQVGINFVGDSYRTTLCLSAEPAKLASAAAFLTFVFLRLVPPPDDKARTAALFSAINISERSLKAICGQMAELYLDNKKCAPLIRDLARMGHVPPDALKALEPGPPGPPP